MTALLRHTHTHTHTHTHKAHPSSHSHRNTPHNYKVSVTSVASLLWWSAVEGSKTARGSPMGALLTSTARLRTDYIRWEVCLEVWHSYWKHFSWVQVEVIAEDYTTVAMFTTCCQRIICIRPHIFGSFDFQHTKLQVFPCETVNL